MGLKFAVSERDCVMDTVVEAELEFAAPSPVHPVKLYPVLGVATIVGVVP